MAFITHLQTQPNYRRLFKLAIWIFLLPLIVLAIAPVVIVLLARLPAQGQALFAYMGGGLAAAPVVRTRMIRFIYDERFDEASLPSVMFFPFCGADSAVYIVFPFYARDHRGIVCFFCRRDLFHRFSRSGMASGSRVGKVVVWAPRAATKPQGDALSFFG